MNTQDRRDTQEFWGEATSLLLIVKKGTYCLQLMLVNTTQTWRRQQMDRVDPRRRLSCGTQILTFGTWACPPILELLVPILGSCYSVWAVLTAASIISSCLEDLKRWSYPAKRHTTNVWQRRNLNPILSNPKFNFYPLCSIDLHLINKSDILAS